MTKRQNKDNQALDAYFDRLATEAATHDQLVEIIAGELEVGRTWTEIKIEVGRRFSGTRYRLVLDAYETAKAALQ